MNKLIKDYIDDPALEAELRMIAYETGQNVDHLKRRLLGKAKFTSFKEVLPCIRVH